MKIIVENLKKNFNEAEKAIVVLNGVNITFEQGKSYAILGASGTGKSTFLHLLAGIDDPDFGAIYFCETDSFSIFSKNDIGENGSLPGVGESDKVIKNERTIALAQMSEAQKEVFLNKTVGLMFQLPYLISEISVLENVAMPGLIAGKTLSECKERALEILSDLEISEKANCLPDTLSGGQQQRVALARAIFNQPKFLLADEPTGNLDPKTGKLIVDLLVKCKEKWGMGLIISSHDAYVAQSMENKFRLEGGVLNKLS